MTEPDRESPRSSTSALENVSEVRSQSPRAAAGLPSDSADATTQDAPRRDFIRQIVREDLDSGKHSDVVTRFPPEPNGFLHIGHAKSICLNFGVAREFGGRCNLRFDDTNPTREDTRYVESIQEDVRWLGFDWGEHLYFASSYFERLYQFALDLIRAGKAYVCDLTPEQLVEHRGSPSTPGRESPFRNRGVEENLDLFERMRNGEFPDGAKTLRAKIDMASPNLHLRDPALYRIRRAAHHRTGDRWLIYPMYDFTHCLSDALEGVTHSLCTLEFEVHRPLYDWVLDQVTTPSRPRQIEFARLNLSYTVMSKRKLLQLVQDGQVAGWDDPRMPTLAGLRRRGYTPASIRKFSETVGVTKYDALTDVAVLEHSLRDDLNKHAPRAMAVLRPLKLTLTNYPEDREEMMEAVNNPEDPSAGVRQVPFSRSLYIERDDFMEDPPKKYFRLQPGGEVRLRYAYIIRCVDVVKDSAGEVSEVLCTIDPDSKRGGATAGRKIKGTIHWVSAKHALDAEARLYDRLFTVEEPDAAKDRDFTEFLNPNSLEILRGCKLEPSLAEARPSAPYQFERLGYFCADPVDSSPGRLVFNRTVTLRDSWAKAAART